MSDAGRRAGRVVALVVISVFITLLITSMALAGRDSRVFPSNFKVGGVHLGGLSLEESRMKLASDLAKVRANELVLKWEGNVLHIPLRNFGIEYDIDATVQKAEELLNPPKGTGPVLHHILLRGGQVNITPAFKGDEKQIYGQMKKIKDEYDKPAQDARIYYHGDQLEYVSHQYGLDIDAQKSSYSIVQALQNGLDEPITLSTRKVSPWIKLEDIKNVKQLLGVYAIKGEDLSSSSIQGLLTGLNGSIILSDERVLWQSIFNRVSDKKAGDLLDEKAQLEVVRGMISLSRQAGLKTDKDSIINDKKYPVLLVATQEGETLLLRIYGCQTDGNRRIAIQKEEELLSPQVRYQVNPSLRPDQRIVDQEGTNGRVQKIFRVVYNNDVQIEKELLAEEWHPAVDTVILVGPNSPPK